MRWNWSLAVTNAFTKVKELITSDLVHLVLSHYNPERPLRLACDASPVGIRAVFFTHHG